jgi:hypothetical protein
VLRNPIDARAQARPGNFARVDDLDIDIAA